MCHERLFVHQAVSFAHLEDVTAKHQLVVVDVKVEDPSLLPRAMFAHVTAKPHGLQPTHTHLLHPCRANVPMYAAVETLNAYCFKGYKHSLPTTTFQMSSQYRST